MPREKRTGKKIFIGITGGIGAGKSAFARILESQGYPVLSADRIAREITEKGSDALPEIVKVFGARSLLADGRLDRAFLREEISRDPSKRRQLEAITHPRIQQKSRARAKAEFEKGAEIVFYEAPLLFEAKSERGLDAVICVAADQAKRVQRVMTRDQVSREQAEALLLAQMPQEEKIQKSNFVVWNNGAEEGLKLEAEGVLNAIRSQFLAPATE